MKKTTFVIFITILMSFGCTVRQADFTILSTKNVEISRVDLKRIQLIRNQQGRDARLWFLFIPLGGKPTIEEAVDKCLENGDGDFMTSAVISRTWWSTILFTYGAWNVRGNVGNSLSYPTAELPDRRLPSIKKRMGKTCSILSVGNYFSLMVS